MSWHAKYNCENCEFRVQQFDIKNNECNVCIISGQQIGLIETCNKFKKKCGEHVTM